MRLLRLLGWAAVVGVVYAAGALVTYRYLSAPGSSGSFFPPAGLTLAVLLIAPRRTWPLFLAVIAFAELSFDLVQGQSLFVSLGFASANVVEPLVGASLMIAVATFRPSRTARGSLAQYVACGVVAGPFVGGFIGGAVTAIAGNGAFLSTWSQWWLGDALGVLVVATPILAWTRRRFYRTPASPLELLGIAAAAGLVTIVPALHMHESFAYAVLPIVMVAAIRGGPLGVGTSGLAVGFCASWVVATGHATTLLSLRGPEAALADTQLFIAVTLLTALTLAIEVAERTRAEAALLLAESQRVGAELAGLQAATAERQRIARETHDIMGHALNVMILSGAAARRVLDRDAEQAKELLATVEEVGRDAFRDLDVALGLTDQSPEFASPRGLADLEELVGRLTQAGMRVEYEVEGRPRALPKLVDGSAYRIIQESLTNVAKHAGGAHTVVHVQFLPSALVLEVSDRGGQTVSTNGGTGRGLIGMSERVAVLGGRIEAGPRVDGGYLVIAELPIGPE